NLPLYMQFKKNIIERIKKGEMKPGSVMQTESELCIEYGISRYPVRQAMDELEAEGYVHRKRGKGTFVCNELPVMVNGKRLLGLILPNLSKGFCGQIFKGFEKQAGGKGYLVAACSTDGLADEEDKCIDRMVESDVNGIFLFPCEKSRVGQKLGRLTERGIYLGIMDRNPGLVDIDYVGSDNRGGAYSAVRHLAMQGYGNVAFVSDKSNVSSIDERMEGYLKAVEDFGLNSITHINVHDDLSKYSYHRHRVFLDDLREELIDLKKNLPLGIFAVNDGIAMQCMLILKEEGFAVGTEIGIVGFDNIIECDYTDVPLTTVAQNGLLLGFEAANMAIGKIEGISHHVYKSIIPTQLVVRKSCNEGM
ncbi:MAG: GntR family transcriptional regulator, partial [Clostridiales bacterium]|nr:GntR family transcriptional regulator [Clostridiales bacterium]